MADNSLLIRLDANGVWTLAFDAPATKNAIDTTAQRRLVTLLRDAERNPAVKVVVITGAGKAFCTGADVRSMGAPDPEDPIAQQYGDTAAWQDIECRTDRLRFNALASELLHRMGKPTVARLPGPAAGIGFSIAMACDFRIAARSASLVPAFVRIGTSGDYGGLYFLTALVGPAKAKEICMLGEKIGAEEALRLGLVNRVVDDATLDAEVDAFVARLATGPSIALRYIKENVHAAQKLELEAYLNLESRNMIRTRLTQDCKEAMTAFLEKREPRFRGA